MQLHIYIDNSDIEPSRLDEIFTPISEEISGWIGGKKQNIHSLSSSPESESIEGDTSEPKLGISIQVKAKHKLKDPLNFLYSLAKTYKCEFAIAIIYPDTNETEDICYFGYEEGRPDLFEIANYLSL